MRTPTKPQTPPGVGAVLSLPFRPLVVLAALISVVVAGCSAATAATEDRAGTVAAADTAVQEGPSTVQAGAPGEASRILGPDERAITARLPHTEADARFMQNMIHHHAQALQMSRLVPERAAGDDIRLLARRIDQSQVDEIKLMESWLEARGEEVPEWSTSPGIRADPGAHAHDDHDAHARHDPDRHDAHARHDPDAHDAHGPGHGGHLMAGMLTPEQFEALAAAEGEAFDLLFLEFMIFHHQGAIEMVNELFTMPGAAQDSDIFQFASHVEADQTIEIDRMRSMIQSRETARPHDVR